MKKLFSKQFIHAMVIAFAVAVNCAACPNLAGNYFVQGEDGQVHYSVLQKGCETVAVHVASEYLGNVTAEDWVFTTNKHSVRPLSHSATAEPRSILSHFAGNRLIADADVPSKMFGTGGLQYWKGPKGNLHISGGIYDSDTSIEPAGTSTQ